MTPATSKMELFLTSVTKKKAIKNSFILDAKVILDPI